MRGVSVSPLRLGSGVIGGTFEIRVEVYGYYYLLGT